MIEEKTDGLLQLNKPHEELRLIEERYRAIFNNAAVGIDLVSGEGRFLQANSTLQDMLGYTEEELKGLSIIDITFPDDRHVSQEKLDALTKGVISSYRLEKRYVRKDGALLWADISISAIRGSDGRHIATIGVISDITPRKLTELNLANALAEAQRFSEALDYVPSYVYMKDTQSHYIYANQATLKLFGCSAEELVGCDDTRFFPSDTVKRLQEVDLRVFAGEHTFEEIDVADARCGRRVYWEVKTPIYKEPECKKIWGLLGISTDITERKRVEEALLKSELEFRLMFENSMDGILFTAPDGRIFMANPAACTILDRTEKEICELGRDGVLDLTDPRLPLQLEVRRRDGKVRCELNFKHKEGTVFPAELTSAIFRDSDDEERSMIVFRDITERKRLAEEKDNAIIELQKALSEIKKLSGFLPICSSCKKIRDDEGYWQQVESYISKHSEAKFSHGICPDCMRKLYPEIADEILGSSEKDEEK